MKLLVLITLSNQSKTPLTIGSSVILTPSTIAVLAVSSNLLELDLNYDETHQSSHPALAWGKTLPGLDPFAASFFQVGAEESRQCSDLPGEPKERSDGEGAKGKAQPHTCSNTFASLWASGHSGGCCEGKPMVS